MKNIIPSVFIVLIFILAAAIFLFFSEKKEPEDKFSIDYEKLEELAKSHPYGEKIVQQLKENEQLLYDENIDNDVSAYLGIGFNVRQLGDDRAAITAYKEVLKIDDDNTLALNNIAVSYRETQDLKKAEESYRKLVETNPGDVSAYRNLADVYRFQYPEDEDGVVKIINQGLERVVDPTDLVSYLAVYYRDIGNTQKAIGYFEIFLRLVPDNKAAQEELKRLRAK